ncbi:Hypothetical predicted protein, partial [Marmota monax]
DMKEPNDQDTDGGKSDRSKSSDKRSSKSESKSKDGFEETTDDTLTEGEESYFEEDSDLEDLEGSSSSFPYDDTESGPASREPPGQPAEEAEEEPKKKISESFFYDYNELASMPFVTPNSNIPLDFLVLV